MKPLMLLSLFACACTLSCAWLKSIANNPSTAAQVIINAADEAADIAIDGATIAFNAALPFLPSADQAAAQADFAAAVATVRAIETDTNTVVTALADAVAKIVAFVESVEGKASVARLGGAKASAVRSQGLVQAHSALAKLQGLR